MAIAHLFENFAASYNASLTHGVDTVVQGLLGAVAAPLTTGMTIAVLILGIMATFRRVDPWYAAGWTLRLFCVGTLLTAAYFDRYIETPILHTIPNFIARSVSGALGQEAGARQFDILLSSVRAISGVIYAEASGIWDWDYRIRAALITTTLGIIIAIMFLVWQLANFMLSLLVVSFVFVLGLYLFSATREVVGRAVGQVIHYMLLLLLTSVMTQINYIADTGYLDYVSTTPGIGLAERLAAYENIMWFFGMSLVVALFIPGMAAFLGGGVSVSIAGIIVYPIRKISSMRLTRSRR